ncbi:MAG TPA: PepSY-associated TM helix domain-containing protein [Methylocella sp.]|nr:PepSY-associated TM helix domain-containing protein [Methylocella sp.]
MVRHFFVFIHRWAELAMALFLVVVGLTGSVLAFREELDVWLNPKLLTVAKRDAPLLDGFVLHEKAAALYPEAQLNSSIPLYIEPRRSVRFVIVPRTNFMAKAVEFYLDPIRARTSANAGSGATPRFRARISSPSSTVCILPSHCPGARVSWAPLFSESARLSGRSTASSPSI